MTNRNLNRRTAFKALAIPATVTAAIGLAGSPAYSKSEVTTQSADTPQVTIAELRAMSTTPEPHLYLVTDPGKLGHFAYDPSDSQSADNTGTVIVTGGGARMKRQFDGPLNVRWFGAKGDGSGDDAPAIQAAIDYAQNGGGFIVAGQGLRAVYLPRGMYRIGATIDVAPNSRGLRIFGDGWNQTILIAVAGDSVLDALIRFSATDDIGAAATNAGYILEDMYLLSSLTGGGQPNVKYGIYAPRITTSVYRNLIVYRFQKSCVAISYGWRNRFENCVLTHATNGIEILPNPVSPSSPAAALNEFNIIGGSIAQHAGAAVNLLRGGQSVRINQVSIEGNGGPAVYAGGVMGVLDVSNCYFEQNCPSPFAVPGQSRSTSAHIVLNPPTPIPQYGFGPVRISNNIADLNLPTSESFFVDAGRVSGGLELENNYIANSTAHHKRLLSTHAQQGDSLLLRNLSIKRNRSTDASYYESIAVGNLAGGHTALHEAGIEGVLQVNYAPPLGSFVPLASPASGTWTKSSSVHRGKEIWILGGAQSTTAWGFTLDMDEHPELAEKYVYFACLARSSGNDTTVALATSQLGPQTTPYVNGTDWHVASYVDKLPSSGNVTFGVRKVSTGTATTVLICAPVLSEVGVRYESHFPSA